jgi:hypothetical protein
VTERWRWWLLAALGGVLDLLDEVKAAVFGEDEAD